MKKINTLFQSLIFYILLTLTLSSNPDSARSAEGDSLFTGIQVHTLNIKFSQPNYWDSLVFYYEQGLEHYMSATVIANGVTMNNIGVRMKGNSSFTAPNNKKSFRLSFNEFVSGQRWDGLKGIHLNNVWNDPTFIREKLHLDFCQKAGIAAPRSNFVKLYINDTLFSFYSLVEHVDKIFLSSRFGNNSGDQFKAVDGFGATTGIVSDFQWQGSDTNLYLNRYELKSDLETRPWGKLITLIDTLNHSNLVAASLPDKAELQSIYRAMGADILMGNMDSYVYSGRNFYIYFPPPAYKLSWIVWDASLSFGALPGGPSNIESLPVTYVAAERPLFSKIINEPSLKNEYLLVLCNMFRSYFSSTELFARIDSIANIIRPYVYEDPRKMYTNTQFETNIISDIVVSGNRKPGLKSFITLRKSSVQSQLNTLGINCDVGISNENLFVRSFELSQNYPNPFNPKTIISYRLNTSDEVSLKVFDVMGNEVAALVNAKQSPGSYQIEFEGINFPSGVYYYRLKAGNYSEVRKMILLK